MKNLSIMDMLDRKTDLRKPAKDTILLKELLFRFLLNDCFSEITAFGVLHYNFEFVMLSDVNFSEIDDIRVLQVTENLRLLHGFLFLFCRHVFDIHLFND